MPALIPVTIPDALPIVALDGLLLLHTPPDTVLVSVVLLPTHTCVTPAITGGNVTTVTVSTTRQPEPSVYVTGIVPAYQPVTTPVIGCTEPTDGIGGVVVPLLHVPPAGVLIKFVAKPAHIVRLPVIGVGFVFTVIGCVAIQLVGSMYDITTVPGATPKTVPVASTVAIVISLLIQPPPAVALVSVVLLPTQMSLTPTMMDGSGFTVTSSSLRQPVGSVYVIIVVPGYIPVTTPVPASMLAGAPLGPLQIPTGVLASVVVRPSHTCGLPVIGVGSGSTVSTNCALQPVPSAYVSITVPWDIPPTIPLVEPMVPIAVLLLLHVPPPVVLVSMAVLPSHTRVGPVVPLGIGCTGIVLVE